MIRGAVIGEVWATRKAPGLAGRKLLLVAVRGVEALSDRVVVAIDTMDAHVGQEVTVSFGSGARNVIAAGPPNRALLADAAVSVLIDGEG
ncbi:MAG TPA: EutN/CcmL family microcompartment protein [Polyangia bacterium]|nr:EutN/CcmL family microcompartment protein [Polyangia bacterium]